MHRRVGGGLGQSPRGMNLEIMSKARTSVPPAVECQARRLHHVGFVVDSIDSVAERFAKSLGAEWDGKITFDPLQGVKVSFIWGSDPAATSIELVEPAATDSPVSRFLERGGGLHHLCYEVENLEEELNYSRSVGGVVVRQPLPAVAFGGRRIAWVITRDKLAVEFLETGLESPRQ